MKKIDIKIDKKRSGNFALSDKAVTEFQEICFEVYGLRISREKAQEEGYNLLRVVKLSTKFAEVANG
jgi:hypothetical protein